MLDSTAAIGPDARIHAPRRVCMFPACAARQKKQTALHALQVRHRSTKYGSQAPSYVTSMDMDGINAVSLEEQRVERLASATAAAEWAHALLGSEPLSP